MNHRVFISCNNVTGSHSNERPEVLSGYEFVKGAAKTDRNETQLKKKACACPNDYKTRIEDYSLSYCLK